MHIPLLTVSLSPQHILVKQPCEGPVLSNSEQGGGEVEDDYRRVRPQRHSESLVAALFLSLTTPNHGQCKKLKKWGGALIC